LSIAKDNVHSNSIIQIKKENRMNKRVHFSVVFLAIFFLIGGLIILSNGSEWGCLPMIIGAMAAPGIAYHNWPKNHKGE